MSGKRPKPPDEGAWGPVIADINSRREARAAEAGVKPVGGGVVRHAGHRRRDLWDKLWDVAESLEGDAATRLNAAMQDPLSSESLVTTLETWEAKNGALAAERQRQGIEKGAVAVKLRKTRETLPDESGSADLIARVVLDAIEIEENQGTDEAKELKRAVRAYAGAVRRLRTALTQAENAAPKAKAAPRSAAKAARLRLAEDLCRALGGKDDHFFWEVFAAVWRALIIDNPDNPDPPNMQDTRAHVKK